MCKYQNLAQTFETFASCMEFHLDIVSLTSTIWGSYLCPYEELQWKILEIMNQFVDHVGHYFILSTGPKVQGNYLVFGKLIE